MKQNKRLQKRAKPRRKRLYNLSDRALRMRIFTLYDGPNTDTMAALKGMDAIYRWIKDGNPGPRPVEMRTAKP